MQLRVSPRRDRSPLLSPGCVTAVPAALRCWARGFSPAARLRAQLPGSVSPAVSTARPHRQRPGVVGPGWELATGLGCAKLGLVPLEALVQGTAPLPCSSPPCGASRVPPASSAAGVSAAAGMEPGALLLPRALPVLPDTSRGCAWGWPRHPHQQGSVCGGAGARPTAVLISPLMFP